MGSLKGDGLADLLAHLLNSDAESVRAMDWEALHLSAGLFPRSEELDEFFEWLDRGGHPPFDCDECGTAQHMRWSLHDADNERRKKFLGDAVLPYDEVLKTFEGHDLAVIDQVIDSLWFGYKAEERADLSKDD